MSVRRGALLSAPQVGRQLVLKDPAISLARILCVNEPISILNDDEPAPHGWPNRNRRQCVYLNSICAAGALGRETESTTSDDADGLSEKETAANVNMRINELQACDDLFTYTILFEILPGGVWAIYQKTMLAIKYLQVFCER